jgi:hypothetical protein
LIDANELPAELARDEYCALGDDRHGDAAGLALAIAIVRQHAGIPNEDGGGDRGTAV